MQKSNVLKLSYFLTSVFLTACGSGGGSSSGGFSSSDSSGLSIKSIATISANLSSSYNPACIYEIGNTVNLINANGSGTGLSLSLVSGQVSAVSGLPSINLANGDKCLANYQQLTWINSANPLVVNLFDPMTNTTTSANLAGAGISGSDIDKASFDVSGTSVYSNNSFNSQFGFSKFILPDPTGYSQLDNSLYANRNITNVVYGFNGAGSQFFQLIPSRGSLPAAIAYIQTDVGTPVQHLSPITNSSGQAISAMSSAWDFTSGGNGVIITTGLVQPVLFKCPLVSAYAYQCTQSYTGVELTTKYRIMRLLGSNASYVYFMGIDLTKSDLEIFSIKL